MYNKFTTDKSLNYFQKETTVLKILSETGNVGYEFVSIEKTYTIDRNRCGLIVQLHDTKSKEVQKAIFDIKHGHSNSDQVFELLYGQGADCNIKIIANDLLRTAYDELNPSADRYLVKTYCKLLKRYDKHIHLVRMKSLVEDSDYISCQKESEEQPDKLLPMSLPSKDEFLESEFWLFYYDYYEGYDHPVFDRLDLWFNFLPRFEVYHLNISPKWDDKGLSMVIETTTDIKGLENLMNDKIQSISDFVTRYQKNIENEMGIPACGNMISLQKHDNGTHSMKVLFMRKPFSEVLYSRSIDKDKYAEFLFCLGSSFAGFIDGLDYHENSRD